MDKIDIAENYTRQQAIDDGLLIDVTPLVQKYEGVTFRVAISKSIWNGDVVRKNEDTWRDVVIIASKYRFQPEGIHRSSWAVTDPKVVPLMLTVIVKVECDPDLNKLVTVFSSWEEPDFRCPRLPGTSFHTN